MTVAPAVDAMRRELAARASAGRGGVFVVEGAAASGKSAVLDELVDAARAAGASVQATRASRADTTRSFGCLLDVLGCRLGHPDPAARRVAEALVSAAAGAAPRDDAWRLPVQEAVVELLRERARAQVVAVAVDDAHLADAGTLGVLRALARVATDEPVLVLWSERTGRADAGLVDLGARVAAFAHRAVLDTRVGHATADRELPRPTADLLAVAAVVGATFDVATFVALTGEPPGVVVGRLTPAVESGVLRASALGSYAFVARDEHAAFVAALPSSMRDALHREVGMLLAARPGEAAAAARHLAIGVSVGDDDAAQVLVDVCRVVVLEDAARAASLLGDAARGATVGSPTWVAATLARLDVLLRLGRVDAVRAVADDAARVHLPLDAEALVRRFGALADAAMGMPARAVAELEALVADDALADATRAALLASLAWCVALDDPRTAAGHADVALAIGDAGAHPEVEAEALAAAALAALTAGDAARAVGLARRAVAGRADDERATAVLVVALEAAGAAGEAALWRDGRSWDASADPVLQRLFSGPGADPPPVAAAARARRSPVTLTAKERETARLVADGLTNTDIATRLGVSRRTVEYHMSNLYAKVGVATRTALAAAVRSGAIDF